MANSFSNISKANTIFNKIKMSQLLIVVISKLCPMLRSQNKLLKQSFYLAQKGFFRLKLVEKQFYVFDVGLDFQL